MTLREGDIYWWRWRDAERHNDCGPFRSYHCKSRIAVVENGVACDTYWGTPGRDRLNLKEVKLRLMGNVNDMTIIHEWQVPYYDRMDIVDLRHANNSRGPIYLKAGATKSAAAMRAVAERAISEAQSEIRMATDRIERLKKELAKIEAGSLDEVYL